ncbi:hypothetical protein B0O80DRAFT_455141 [Mortierella sp. GBAus27b]|nr:hypothetical protein B0O80DRAFT_455141 [Mortierella sp. GBAus27b]
MRQQQEEEQEGIQIEQKEQLNLHDLLVHEPKLDPENGQQHTDAERPSISQPLPALPPASLSVIRSSAVASVGRPRSSSTASMISNLSEKIRIGSNIFGRTGRSRAGSDASITPASPTTAQPHHSSLSTETPMSSSSTTMAAIASASAIASAMTLPRSSAYTPDTTCNSAAGDSGVVEAPGGGKTKRASARHSGLAHPLAESAHIDDKSEDHDRWDESSKNGSNP